MKKLSAGLLLYRLAEDRVLEVLIAHMGGPFWAKKDNGAWSIPKGEYTDEANPLDVARREFEEEMGHPAPEGEIMELGELKQPSGKMITTFAQQSDFDASNISSNTFEMEWPKGSGKVSTFPEVDRAEWFDVATARGKLVKGQIPFLDRLMSSLADAGINANEARTSSASDPYSLF